MGIFGDSKETMNLTTKTVQGVGWSGTSQIARLLLRLGITAILARLLTLNSIISIASVGEEKLTLCGG